MDLDTTVQVMVRVVAVVVVNCKSDNIGDRPSFHAIFHGVKHKQVTNLLFSILIESVLRTSPATGIMHL